MGKVILTEDQAKALDIALKEKTFGELMRISEKHFDYWGGELSALNGLSSVDYVAISERGYCSQSESPVLSQSDLDSVDVVNRPSHYNQGKFEAIDIILDVVKGLPGDQATLVGNILKYVIRYSYKNGSEDLKKSEWYLKKLILIVEGAEKND